jgi:hypothetical protein
MAPMMASFFSSVNLPLIPEVVTCAETTVANNNIAATQNDLIVLNMMKLLVR